MDEEEQEAELAKRWRHLAKALASPSAAAALYYSSYSDFNNNARAARQQVLWGAFLVLFSVLFLIATMYAILVSKWLPHSENDSGLLAWIASDRYYCLLVPMTVPVTVFAIYLHWLSMKFFKHA
eukprot:jgi/Chlat1/3385/Chrsp23S03724